MRNLIFVITLCLPVVCFGQLNGRAMICDGLDGNERVKTYQFGNDSVTQKFVFRKGDSFAIGEEDAIRYSVSATEVTWNDIELLSISGEYKIGDTTLILSRKTGILVETANEYPSHLRRYECQIFADLDSYYSELERMRDSLQEIYDKEREGNLL